jgi:transposase
VPIEHGPEEAQADFGYAKLVVAGQPVKAAFFVMTLPVSNALFCCLFPRESTESFREGHVRAFAFFGGVPRRISYDNTWIAVFKISHCGSDKELRRRCHGPLFLRGRPNFEAGGSSGLRKTHCASVKSLG